MSRDEFRQPAWSDLQNRRTSPPTTHARRSRRGTARPTSSSPTAIESALAQAREAAGGKDVVVVGGANVVQQYLTAGLVDEFQIHVAPLLLGDGVRLFDRLGPTPPAVEVTRAIESPAVTHVTYRVGK